MASNQIKGSPMLLYATDVGGHIWSQWDVNPCLHSDAATWSKEDVNPQVLAFGRDQQGCTAARVLAFGCGQQQRHSYPLISASLTLAVQADWNGPSGRESRV